MILTFGKHKGKNDFDVPWRYIEWAIDNVKFYKPSKQALENVKEGREAVYKPCTYISREPENNPELDKQKRREKERRLDEGEYFSSWAASFY